MHVLFILLMQVLLHCALGIVVIILIYTFCYTCTITCIVVAVFAIRRIRVGSIHCRVVDTDDTYNIFKDILLIAADSTSS